MFEWRSSVRSHCESCEHKSSVTTCKWNGRGCCLKLYASIRFDLFLVASCESLYVSMHCFDNTVALMTCSRRES